MWFLRKTKWASTNIAFRTVVKMMVEAVSDLAAVCLTWWCRAQIRCTVSAQHQRDSAWQVMEAQSSSMAISHYEFSEPRVHPLHGLRSRYSRLSSLAGLLDKMAETSPSASTIMSEEQYLSSVCLWWIYSAYPVLTGETSCFSNFTAGFCFLISGISGLAKPQFWIELCFFISFLFVCF